MERLRGRKTEDPENVKKRLQKAAEELQYENRFDKVLVNDQLEKALSEAEQLVDHFLTS
jgi:guanylate kinase